MSRARPYSSISACRACGSRALIPILSLGRQALTGVFPKDPAQSVTAGPVDLVKCDESKGAGRCGLVQLRQTYDQGEMYGDNYGYHSSLNKSMVAHLSATVARLVARVKPAAGDLIVDIGSNDATTLKAYPRRGLRLVGVDPTGKKFRKHYPSRIALIPDFFSARAVRARVGDQKAKIVTSIAMFYDLPAPLEFTKQVSEILADDGVWLLEQSYLPLMLERNAYDTLCHEHLEYYGLRQIRWMAERAGLKILDVGLNDINGGSFWVMLAKAGSPLRANAAAISRLLRREAPLSSRKPYDAFRRRTFAHRDELRRFFKKARVQGKTIVGYGASTKGNVILQFCGLTAADMPAIGEVNPDKFGCFTPGSKIPIVPESRAKALRPDYMMVLPWHFKDFILKKEAQFLKTGRLLFPLPSLRVY
jgi:NDP-4-keto-2,6-dideoxyhexose 3-C-methyltransferase